MLLCMLVMLSVVATGCATREYVDQKVGELDTKWSDSLNQVRSIASKNQSDIAALSGRVGSLEQSQRDLTNRVSALEQRPMGGGLGKVAMSEDVMFEFGRYRLTKEAMAKLDSLASQLQGGQGAVHLVGHTDSRGGEIFNFNLGRRRAEMVSAYLAQKGVERHRLIVITLGEATPIASNQDRAGRSQNRRVEIRLLQ
jgi:outer membrane protein OmpA-like peptidoglycan-associated protein